MTKIPGSTGATMQPMDVQHLYDSDSSKFTNGNNGFYETLNTPLVDLNGPNGVPRVYIEGSGVCFPAFNKSSSCNVDTPRQGQLFVFDVDPKTGKLTAVTGGSYPRFYFPAPSGSSPAMVKDSGGHTEVFFDGLTYSDTYPDADCHQSNPNQGAVQISTPLTGCYYGVVDDGTQLTELWNQKYPSAQFQAAATVDPRGGLWIHPMIPVIGTNCNSPANPNQTPYRNCMVHIGTDDGNVLKASDGTPDIVDVSLLFNEPPPDGGPYDIAGVPTVMSTPSGGVAMALGAHLIPQAGSDIYFMVIDVTTRGAPIGLTQTGGPLQLPTGSGMNYNIPAGQFPVVSGSQGLRIVFTSRYSGPIFVGD
jgi:hypothetical protein